jgi:hypothetical protein
MDLSYVRMARMDAVWIVRNGATRTLAYKLDIDAGAVIAMAIMGLRQTAISTAPMSQPWLAVGRPLNVVANGRIASTARANRLVASKARLNNSR